MARFQREKLLGLLQHAYRKVRFYRERYDAHGVDLPDIRGIEDLGALPTLSKSDLQQTPVDDLLAGGLTAAGLELHSTSGSTGEPVAVYRTRGEDFLLQAPGLRLHRYYGVTPTDRVVRVAFRRPGRLPALWRALQRVGVFRHVHLDSLDAPSRVVQQLAHTRPDVVTGYTWALAEIAGRLRAGDRENVRPKFVVTCAEVLAPAIRTRLAEAFRAPVFDLYGCVELQAIAWECKESGLYHVCDDTVVVEVLKNGRPAAPGETGEVVCTGLHSRAMPLIRYRLGDLARKGPTPCPCGLPFSTLETITGRVNDIFKLPGGRVLDPFEIEMALGFVERAPWVRRYQLIQEREDRVRLRIAADAGPKDGAVAELIRPVRELLGEEIDFAVDIVDSMAPGPGGKHRPHMSLLAPRT